MKHQIPVANTTTSSSVRVNAASDASIDALPNELLIEIFLCVQARQSRTWYRVLWVCKRWSSIARQSPELWSHIYFGKHASRSLLETCLRASGELPLELFFTKTALSSANFSLLEPHLARVRRMHMNDMPRDGRLHALLQHDMPTLEDLQVRITPNRPGAHAGPGLYLWEPRPGQYPVIKRLMLGRRVSFVQAFPFPTLTHLELHNCVARLTLSQFAEFLTHYPHLAELSLTRFQPETSSASTSGQLTVPPTLRRFTLEDETAYIKAFLSVFHFPANVDIHITRLIMPKEFQDNPSPALIYSLRQILPDSHRLANVSLASALEVRRSSNTSYRVLARTADSNVLELAVRVHEADSEHPLLDSYILHDLAVVFSGAPVVDFRISGIGPSTLDKWEWVEIFAAFSSVEQLTLERMFSGQRWEPQHTLIEALNLTTWSRGTEKGTKGTPVTVLPLLKSLTIVSDVAEAFDGKLSQELATLLKSRSARGSRLDEVRLVLQRGEAGRKERYIKAMQRWVNSVEVEFSR
ncbi:hypothetical protein C8Q76DRAFT_801561 [Earliella scabrosa]|nr:hypothetical protein C8Q76DRAFT_801561 [Earliella scabrosa]